MITYSDIEERLVEIKRQLDSGNDKGANKLVEDLKDKIVERKKRTSENVLAYRTSSAKQIKLHSLNNRIYDARKRGNEELVNRLMEEKSILLNGE